MTQAPENTDSYALTRHNALRHGILSRFVVLPWEDLGAFQQLLAALVAEHGPHGPTEEHLVEEIAGVFWRKRRLRMGEAAIHRDRLAGTLSPFSDTAKAALAHLGETDEAGSVADALRATDGDTAEAIADIDNTSGAVNHAMELLDGNDGDAYQTALALLPEETQQWWAESIVPKSDVRDHEDQPYVAEAASLQLFLQDEVMPWLLRYRVQLVNRPLVRGQAFGRAIA